MVFEDLEVIVNKLSQFLENEKILLERNKRKQLLENLDEKTHLFLEFHKAVNYFQNHSALIENVEDEKKQNFRLKIIFILELATHNEALLEKMDTINNRVLQKIIHNVRKIGEPFDSYVSLSRQKNISSHNIIVKTLHPVSLDHQI